MTTRRSVAAFVGAWAACVPALAGDYFGYFTTGHSGGTANIGWSSDFGPGLADNWGVPTWSGPHAGSYNASVSADLWPQEIGVVSATFTGDVPGPQATPTSQPLHLAWDLAVDNRSGTYGITSWGDLLGNFFVSGPVLHYRVNWTAHYTGSDYQSIAGGAVGISAGSTSLVNSIVAPGTTMSGVLFVSSGDSSLTMGASLYQGQSVAGNGHLVVTADIYLDDKPFPPAEPAMTSPVNGASNQSATPTLAWSAAAGATSYTVRIADNPLLSNPVHTAAGLTDTSYSVPAQALAGCTQYWWGVSAENAHGSSASIPAAFSLTTAPQTSLAASLSGNEPYLTCPGGAVVASAVASGSGAYAYRWQARLDLTGWFDLAEGINAWDNGAGGAFHAAGTAGDTVTITGLADAPEDVPFSGAIGLRCVVSTACDEVTTEHALVLICAADYNCDGFVTGEDFDSFVSDFELGLAAADVNLDTFVTGEDFDMYVERFASGC